MKAMLKEALVSGWLWSYRFKGKQAESFFCTSILTTPLWFRAIQPFAAINVIHFLIAGVFKITKATLQPLHAAACSTASRCSK